MRIKRKKSLHRYDVISQICNETGVERADAEDVVLKLFETIKRSLEEGKSISFRPYMNFVVKKYGRKSVSKFINNPDGSVSAERVPLPDRYVPVCVFSKQVKNSVRKNLKVESDL